MTSTCEVLGYLLNGEYFYVISLVSFLVVVALLLAALSYEQLLNIAVNTVRTYPVRLYGSRVCILVSVLILRFRPVDCRAALNLSDTNCAGSTMCVLVLGANSAVTRVLTDDE
jgi:hypothetical protein